MALKTDYFEIKEFSFFSFYSCAEKEMFSTLKSFQFSIFSFQGRPKENVFNFESFHVLEFKTKDLRSQTLKQSFTKNKSKTFLAEASKIELLAKVVKRFTKNLQFLFKPA